MNQTRRVGVIRIGILLITGLAWFGIANHCVLAALETPAANANVARCHEHCKATVTRCHENCGGNQSPAKGKDQRTTECCKTLRATLNVPAKKLAPGDTSLLALQLYFVTPVIFPSDSKVATPGVEFDTGPPRSLTFAELILQRSILAHAPPFLG